MSEIWARGRGAGWSVLLVLAVLMGCATGAPSRSGFLSEGTGGAGALDEVPARERLTPFLACDSPARFVALQQGVDMARLVGSLDDWSAVRLGAQGPVVETAASLLNLKRTTFLLWALERYGALRTEVLARFLVDTAHGEYIEYYEERLGQVRRGKATKGPLPWAFYEQMRGGFARGLAFERTMVERLREDARLPRAQRRYLGGFEKPRIETNVGVKKPGPGLRYVDVLVIEEGATNEGPRRVETFSCKSRDLSDLDGQALKAQMLSDAKEASSKYGGTMDVRRGSLRPLLPEGNEVRAQQVRLVYEGGAFAPMKMAELRLALDAIKEKVSDVEVSFQ